jgi:hypothetical protein
MRFQMFRLCAAVVAMMAFSPASKAGCDSKCETHAYTVGEGAARHLLASAVSNTDIFELARAEGMLRACGDKSKADAVDKRLRPLLMALIHDGAEKVRDRLHPESKHESSVAITSFMATSNALAAGYVLGYSDMAKMAMDRDPSLRDEGCLAGNTLADNLLSKDVTD